MESLPRSYCRFCAEAKSPVKLLNLQNDDSKRIDVTNKLSFLNATYLDLSDDFMPRTICLVCYDSLKKAYDFLSYVQNAQSLLINKLNAESGVKNVEISYDDHNTDYAFQSDDEKPLGDIKVKKDPCSSMQIKQELKEEIPDEVFLDMGLEDSSSSKEYNDQNLDEILDAAISNRHSKVSIYAKEISKVSKRQVNSWKDYSWVCSICYMDFFDLESLRSHGKIVHDKCNVFVCTDCKKFKATNDFSAFIEHVRKHWKKLRHCCVYCDAIDIENINKHTEEHIQNPSEHCPRCGEILPGDAFTSHIQVYGARIKVRRKRGVQITTDDLTCHICNKVYKRINSLRDHIKRHKSDRKREYTCDRCGKMYFNKGALTSHIMTHEQIRPHVCKICKQAFKFPNMLRRHVDMHTGVKPYSCEQCGRQFRLSHQLKAHKIIHTDSMPFECKYCHKAFRFKQILVNHERQHTGDKPYTCEICGMDFTNWSNFNKHSKRRHNTDLSKKKITPEGTFPINPETGQIIQVEESEGMVQWRKSVMLPCKRGKKKVIKEERT